MMKIFVYFYEEPQGSKEKKLQAIFSGSGARVTGHGTALRGRLEGRRDVGYEVDKNDVLRLTAELEKANFDFAVD